MRTPIVLYAVALVVRLALIALFPDPAYVDSSYYVDVAQRLAAGHGFTTDVLWVFAEVGGRVPADPTLPIAANAHWMPLAEIIQWPFLVLLGPNPIASALPFALVGALAAPLAWAFAREAGAQAPIPLGAGVLTAIPALSVVFMPQPDNFSLFQPLVLLALWMTSRALHGDRRAFVLAGLFVGLATLSRTDGLLVGAVLGFAFLWDRIGAWRSRGIHAPRIGFGTAVASLALFLACVVPWYARQLAVFGQLSPSTATGRVLFIRSIEEWNSITTPATFDWLLGQGVGPLLQSRLEGLVAAVVVASVLLFAVVLVPFWFIGAWRRRRDTWFGPYLTYVAILFAFSAVVSAVHVPGGTFIHSAVAIAPQGYVLALEGVAALAAWMAARRGSAAVDVASGVRLFVGGMVVLVVVLGLVWVPSVHDGWAARRDRFVAVGDALTAAGAAPDDRVMSIDASGLKYWTGHPGVVLVDDPIETVRQVADAYDIRWLVIDRSDSVPSVAPILLEDRRPPWVGPAVWRDGDDVAVFPVCTGAGDPRCQGSVTA